MELSRFSQAKPRMIAAAMVLPERIELSTSPLPRGCSTTELRQLVRSRGRGTGYTRARSLATARRLATVDSGVIPTLPGRDGRDAAPHRKAQRRARRSARAAGA